MRRPDPLEHRVHEVGAGDLRPQLGCAAEVADDSLHDVVARAAEQGDGLVEPA